MLEVHELYEHVSRYGPETPEGGLFACYIGNFLKLKAEASGYPAWVRRPPDQRYIESFWKSEGIRLDNQSVLTLLNAG